MRTEVDDYDRRLIYDEKKGEERGTTSSAYETMGNQKKRWQFKPPFSLEEKNVYVLRTNIWPEA
jgi:hypothetical protein